MGFPAHCLDQIDDAELNAELTRMGIDIVGRFDSEVRWLLQKPFYFQFIASGAVHLPKEAHPRDFYESFFVNLNRAFVVRFSKPFAIEDALSIVAYDAINRGEEAYPLSDLLRVLKANGEAAGLTDIDSRDIANWLVSTSALVPQIEHRIEWLGESSQPLSDVHESHLRVLMKRNRSRIGVSGLFLGYAAAA